MRQHDEEVCVYDWLIVGAGFAGSVLAERLANGLGHRVLVIDRRTHIGGNAFDYYDRSGVLVHRYGPHIFHTNARSVFDYLSAFTEWRSYEHRVLADVDGRLFPIPINIDTVNRLYGLDLSADTIAAWFANQAEVVDKISTSEDVVVSRVGRDLYEKFFRTYTRKQWGLDPSELDSSVTARIPVRHDRDDRYFTDAYQFMPRDGYTRMFERLLSSPRIDVMLGRNYEEIKNSIPHRRKVFTGCIDEYFQYRFGRLPYRSLEFEHVTLDQPHFQPVGTVNYPQTQKYTRITEYKHLTGQVHPQTSISYEYPSAVGDPYYPIPRAENADLYRRYEALARSEPGTYFVGRLATYRYYNMDQVVGQALATYRRISDELHATSAIRESAIAAG